MNPIKKLWTNTKAAASFVLRFAGRPGWSWSTLGATRYDYAAAVGDGRQSALIMACVRWAMRTFPEAPLRVLSKTGGGDLDPLPDHALAQLLARPNPAYSGLHLIAATVADRMLTGNAYWVKVRSGAGRVVQLWWIPSTALEPQWPDDGSEFISHYEYTVDVNKLTVRKEDVVHFRVGFDPRNIRKGLSDLQALFREVATDDEAANWTASLLRNMGVPGVVIAPETGVSIDPDAAARLKDGFRDRFAGDRRGEAMVVSAAVKVTSLGFSPQQMNLKDLRRVPEERVTAVLGIPAIVVGLGAGLDRSTFSNFAEAREAAYESHVIPEQRLMAAEIETQLLPDFGDPARLVVEHDYSNVRVLQDDRNALAQREVLLVGGGVKTINEGRQAMGLEPLPEGDVLYVPNSVTATDPAELLAEPEPVPMLPPPALGVVPVEDEDEAEEEEEPTEAAAGRVAVQAKDAGDLAARLEAILAATEPALAVALARESVHATNGHR